MDTFYLPEYILFTFSLTEPFQYDNLPRHAHRQFISYNRYICYLYQNSRMVVLINAETRQKREKTIIYVKVHQNSQG